MIISQIPPYTTGRKKIFIHEDEITSDNVIRVVEAALLVHRENVKEIDYLFQLYRGFDPVIQGRERKGANADINTKANVNYYSWIADYTSNLFMQNPIVLVNADGDEKINDLLKEYNKIHRGTNKYARDKTTANHVSICGVGYRFTELDNRTIIRDSVLSPTSVMSLYGDDTEDKAVAKVHITQVYDEKSSLVEDITQQKGITNLKTKERYTVYTDDKVFEFVEGEEYVSVSDAMPWGCPITEYKLNPYYIGSFERALNLIRLLSILRSDGVNGVIQSITGIVFGKNIGLPMDSAADDDDTRKRNQAIRDEFAERLKNQKQIFVDDSKEKVASLDYIATELYNADINTLYDGILKDVVTLSKTPSPSMGLGASGNTGAATTASGVRQALMHAKDGEPYWFESAREQMTKELLVAQYKDLVKGLSPNDVDFAMQRVDYDDVLQTTQAYATLINAGTPPSVAARVVGITEDPDLWGVLVDEYKKKLIDMEVKEIEEEMEVVNEQSEEETNTSEEVIITDKEK